MNTKNNKIEKKKKFSEKNILSISIILMLLSLCIIGVVNIVISDRREVLKNQSVEPVLGMIEEAEESENSLVPAYTIKVGDFQVSLGSKEQVVQLLNKVKSQYDEGEEFTISLKESTSEKEDASEEELIYQAEILRPVITENQLQAVLAAGNGTSSHTAQAEEGAEDGKMMAFEETIEVFEEKLEPSSVITFEEAYNTLMQGSNREEIYVVEEGDCLSEIALKNNIDMEKILEANPVLVDQESILPGQELALVSAKPMIDILTVEKSIYEENILPEPEYIYNNNWYSNREEIKEEGTAGVVRISALVTYRNGVEAGREIVEEKTLVEGKPTVIEKGMLDPKVYISPVMEVQISSTFGERWGKIHKGIDFACDEGTVVVSARSGVVVQAGWVSGYGNCIYVNHDDGSQTRYAHLSQALVKSGDTVFQGQEIALSGNTGNSTGPHLHFEILENDVQIDPLTYID